MRQYIHIYTYRNKIQKKRERRQRLFPQLAHLVVSSPTSPGHSETRVFHPVPTGAPGGPHAHHPHTLTLGPWLGSFCFCL